MTESEAKRLEKLREQILQMKAQERAIICRDKARQRKERTRRLIKYGEIAEKYLDCEGIEAEEFELLLKIRLGEGLKGENINC